MRDAEIAAGTRPKKLLDLDVGYHQELEAANKRLEMDNRLMAPRVCAENRQTMVFQLTSLDSLRILSGKSINLSMSFDTFDRMSYFLLRP